MWQRKPGDAATAVVEEGFSADRVKIRSAELCSSTSHSQRDCCFTEDRDVETEDWEREDLSVKNWVIRSQYSWDLSEKISLQSINNIKQLQQIDKEYLFTVQQQGKSICRVLNNLQNL